MTEKTTVRTELLTAIAQLARQAASPSISPVGGEQCANAAKALAAAYSLLIEADR